MPGRAFRFLPTRVAHAFLPMFSPASPISPRTRLPLPSDYRRHRALSATPAPSRLPSSPAGLTGAQDISASRSRGSCPAGTLRRYFDLQIHTAACTCNALDHYRAMPPDSCPVVRAEDDQPQLVAGEVLLVTDSLISRDHHIKTRTVSRAQQLSIGQLGPAPLVRRLNLVTSTAAAPAYCDRGEFASRRDRVSQASRSVLQHRIHLFSRNPREPLQKLVNCRPALQIREERRYRNACPPKHPRAAQLLGITLDPFTTRPVQHRFHYAPSLVPQRHRQRQPNRSTIRSTLPWLASPALAGRWSGHTRPAIISFLMYSPK